MLIDVVARLTESYCFKMRDIEIVLNLAKEPTLRAKSTKHSQAQ